MRLKSLTIKGFKSFADDTEINFSENLIGIVGPNGSGKSNIVDAVRWVLGEQKTSELRLETMSDVLFNGSKDRKEGKVARVTLSFDNTKHILPTEYSEVSISRVLYRDGNSEYRLNNVPCRKKDIVSLFVDSGIGSDSYAIISLNMVEDILHDKGGYRRKMIEQAAGISKYKIRKQETLNKLKGAGEDLNRVDDLLFEIDKNMSSFERQAKRTEKYNRLKGDYRDKSIKLAHLEVKELKELYEQLKLRLVSEKDERNRLNTEILQDEAILQQLKLDIIQFEKSLNEDQQKFNQLIELLSKAENDKNLIAQRIDSNKEKFGSAERKIIELSNSILTIKNQLEEAKSSESTISAKLTSAEEEFAILDQKHRTLAALYEDLREQEKVIKKELHSNQDRKNALIREQEALYARKTLTAADVELLHQKIVSTNTDFPQKKTALDAVKLELSNLDQLIDKSEFIISDKEGELKDLNDSLLKSTDELNKLLLEKSSLEQRIKFLLNVIENNEGLPESVKFIISENKHKNLSFSDILEVKEDKYLKIVELFLEPFLYHVMAENRTKALSYYKSVRDAQKGKLHIFVLDEIEKNDKQQHHGVVASTVRFLDILKYESKYDALMQRIGSLVFISELPYERFDFANLAHDMTVLFPDEFLIYTRGKIFGGSNTLFEGVQLGRKKLVEKLSQKIAEVELASESKQEQIQVSKKNVVGVQENLKSERNRQIEIKRNRDQKSREEFQLGSTIQSIKENLDQWQQQIGIKTEQIQLISSSQKEVELRLEELSKVDLSRLTDSELSKKIEETHREYLKLTSQKDQSQYELFELRNTHNSLKREIAFNTEQLKQIDLQIASLNAELESSRQSDVILTADKWNKSLELEGLYEKKANYQKEISSREDGYYKEKGKIFEIEKKIAEQRAKIHRSDDLISSLSEKYNETGFGIKSIFERNSIEFGLEIEAESEIELNEGENLESLKAEKEKIHDRIRSFGEINPLAITAYNEIKIRYDHIFHEREDVLKAKADLEKTIEEIEIRAADKFNSSLEQIRINFKKVFQGLFSDDDDCDIVLLDSDSPLEAMIEIVAKPKGKKPRSISQLSGGEKTLTAASFLFALYLLKPAPFCIFDEVDAPLDDVNVLKFNKLVRKFSEDSQFIIITHNKLTMSEVDILYGVFLKEPGVSGVGAVDFREYEQTDILETVD